MRVGGRILVTLTIIACAAAIAVGAAAGQTSARHAGSIRGGLAAVAQHRSALREGTFISLWPACGCGRRTALDYFSLKTGRRLGTVAPVSIATGESVASPEARPGGPVVLTLSSGPLCHGPVGVGASSGPCVPAADSCRSRVETLDPASGTTSTLLSVPDSTSVTDAVPSPNGREVVMAASGCATSYFDQSLLVRDLTSGRQWSIGADAVRCHAIGSVSWSAGGSRLVFPYGPSTLPSGTKPSTAQSCSVPRYSRLAVVPAGHGSSVSSWNLIAADKGCSFQAAAFDRQGIAAAEACRHGEPTNTGSNPQFGDAYLLQLDRHNRVDTRVALKRGWETGRVSFEPRTGQVLVGQDQPANEGPQADWVWQFDGRRLRLVAHYRANDAAQVIAAPW